MATILKRLIVTPDSDERIGANVLHPNNAELHASLGDVYRQLGVLGAARQAGERSVELEPERA